MLDWYRRMARTGPDGSCAAQAGAYRWSAGSSPGCAGRASCASRPAVGLEGIRLFVLALRSPKLHGAVERANRTHIEEFLEVPDVEPDLASFQVGLRAWETVYHTIRPHQALGYLTPAEYLASVGVEV